MTLDSNLKARAQALSAVGVEDPRGELFRFWTEVTGRNRAYFMARMKEPYAEVFNPAEQLKIDEIFYRRQQREPFSYIVQLQDFFGYSFHVGAGVLIPRGDSEILIEVALNLLGYSSSLPLPPQVQLRAATPLHFMDLCTGSGCLGITLSLELEGKMRAHQGILTDISPLALNYATANLRSLKRTEKLTLMACDLFPGGQELADLWGEAKADIILANPPYIPTAELGELMPEVALYEPSLALDGGADGLYFYRRILESLEEYLAPQGFLLLEHGYDQSNALRSLYEAEGYSTQTFNDYGGQQRVTLVFRSGLN